MLNDLDVIVKKYPKWDRIHLYALGDIHVGSEQFDEEAVRKKLRIIKDDPVGVVTLCGDLGDYGLKNSVSNVYKQTLSPAEQQKYIYELFKPVKDKIVSAVPGNHEARVTKEVGLCPLYDLCVKWDIQDVYRENVAILKLTFGEKHNTNACFIGITTHGSSIRKHQRHIASYWPIDWSVAGHSHTPMYCPHGVIRINASYATAKHAAYKEIVVDAHLKPGGYGIKHEYEIAPPPELQYLELRLIRDPDKKRAVHKIMNYHSIQI